MRTIAAANRKSPLPGKRAAAFSRERDGFVLAFAPETIEEKAARVFRFPPAPKIARKSARTGMPAPPCPA
jgi:hypothetical protein